MTVAVANKNKPATTAPKAAPRDAAWLINARGVLEQLDELLLGCYEVIDHGAEYEPIMGPLEDVRQDVLRMAGGAELFTRDAFGAVLDAVRQAVARARTAISPSHRVLAWSVLVAEVERVVDTALEPNKPAPVQSATEEPVFWHSPLSQGGKAARRLTRDCIEEIDSLCWVLTEVAAQKAITGDGQRWVSMLRMSLLRIRALNEVALDYVGEMGDVMGWAHEQLYGVAARGDGP